MTKRRVFTLFFLSILCLSFLTACIDKQKLDQRWLDRAHTAVDVGTISPYFTWVLFLAVPLMIFAFVALLRNDYISFVHWFAIMVVGVGSFLRIVDVIQTFGNILWPDGYTISAVMDWMGWQVPFPDDAVWTSPFAFAFTDLIPSLFSIWQWVLIAVHGAMLIVVSFSRNLKPIAVDFAFIFSWAITPTILAVITRGFAAAKGASSLVVTKAVIETLYVIFGFGAFAVFFVLIPLAVGLAALFLPWGRLNPSWRSGDRKDSETESLVQKLLGRLDRDALAAFLGAFAGSVPPPEEGTGNNSGEYAYATEYPRLPPGNSSSQGYGSGGPDNMGPNPSGTGSPSSRGSGGGPSTAGNGGEKPPSDVVDTEETSAGHFAPLVNSGRLEEPKPVTQGDGDSEQEEPYPEEEGESFPSEKTGHPLASGARGLGKAAKSAAPLVTPLNPEAGLALGLTGALLDRPDAQSEESTKLDFPQVPGSNRNRDLDRGKEKDSDRQKREEGFSSLKHKEAPESKPRKKEQESEQDVFPELRRRQR